MPIASQPQLLSFITCDNIHRDPSTGKYTLLGLFGGLQAVQFPLTHPRMLVFITLSDVASGDHSHRLSLSLPGQEPVWQVEQPFKSAGPLQRIHIIDQLQNVTFERDGDYGFMLEIDDDPLLVTNFPVRSIQLPPGMKLPQQGGPQGGSPAQG